MNPRTSRGGTVLTVLLLAYIFNFIDRNVIGVLAVPIRKEFGLSDTALSQLGIVFGLFYAVIAIPIARLADTRSRVNIIPGADGRGDRRGGRDRPLLRPHLRLFPQGKTRPRARLLLARHPARLGAGRI